MFLSDLKTGEKGFIVRVNGSGAFRKRILEMGFVKGKAIKVMLNAPLKDPIKYKIMDYEVSLRRSEAALIEVVYIDTEDARIFDAQKSENFQLNPDIVEDADKYNGKTEKVGKKITVALVGNPNAGKTSLFNFSSGAHEHVGNYGGVTVNSKEGHFKHKGYTFNIIDLPGTYSLSAYTPEELFVRNSLIQDKPDVIINVVAASNLERNLYLTTELIDLEAPVVIALNMYDELQASGAEFDYKALSTMLGIPMVPTVSRSGEGVDNLFDTVIRLYEGKELGVKHIKISYGNSVENAISKLNIELGKLSGSSNLSFPKRYLSIKLFEKDGDISTYIENQTGGELILNYAKGIIKQLEETLGEDTESILTNARYGFIAGGLKETLKEKTIQSDITGVIDSIVTNKYFGLPLFFFFMWIMFECTFRFGAYPMEWIETGVEWLGNVIRNYMSDGMLKDLIVDGIVGGVGGVIVFLPNILILYAFISFMEDSGYMARAAFIMDKLMHKMGLHGKSFIPLVMGFGCNVPAILATRMIESRNSRMITMLVNPFMSCSARLPVYLLFVGVFFKSSAGLMLFGLYLTGILLAVISARLFKRFLFPKDDTPFVMELPPYRMPTMKAVSIHMWDKSKQYLKKMGGVILIASIIIWFLGYFPINDRVNYSFDSQIEDVENRLKLGLVGQSESEELISSIEETRNITHQENSYIGRIGKFVEPVMKPLGFDWKISISLVTGLAAKEVVVSTLGVIYTGNSESQESLQSRLQNDMKPDGSPTFTPLVVISFLLFVLIYFPCVATIAAIKEESGSWKWSVFSMVYTTGLAWIISFAVYQIGRFIG